MNQDYIKPDNWSIIEEGFDVDQVKSSESLFSIGNGAMGQRANFEEHYSGPTFQGSYIAGVYYPDKTRVGWWKNGYPEYFAKVLNAPSWIGINVSINNEQLDLFACKKVETDPKLDMSLATNPVITSPADGSSYILTEETAEDMISFTWSAATYNLTDLAATTYLLQMITADSSFDNGLELISTTDLAYSTSVTSLNATLLNMGYEGGTEALIDFRVTSSLKSYCDIIIIGKYVYKYMKENYILYRKGCILWSKTKMWLLKPVFLLRLFQES